MKLVWDDRATGAPLGVALLKRFGDAGSGNASGDVKVGQNHH